MMARRKVRGMVCPECEAVRNGMGTLWKLKELYQRTITYWCSVCGYEEECEK